jgi:ribosome maturation factor RimP
MKLNALLDKVIPGLGYELVEVEITPAKVVRVFIDKEGGVTIDDCEIVSNHLNKLFFVEEIDYNRLEVSSPGIERPLRKLQDFIRFSGKLVKIKTRELIDGQKVFQGIIVGVAGETIQLELANGEMLAIEFTKINRARLVFEYKADLKPKKASKR